MPESHPTALQLTLRQARKLHKSALLNSVGAALPSVRRVHAAGLFSHLRLSTLYRERHALLKRKHFLRTLAVEAGFPDWERMRPQLLHLDDVARTVQACESPACLNLWFSTEAQARAYVGRHGGRVVCVGTQAMVPLQEMDDAS